MLVQYIEEIRNIQQRAEVVYNNTMSKLAAANDKLKVTVYNSKSESDEEYKRCIALCTELSQYYAMIVEYIDKAIDDIKNRENEYDQFLVKNTIVSFKKVSESFLATAFKICATAEEYKNAMDNVQTKQKNSGDDGGGDTANEMVKALVRHCKLDTDEFTLEWDDVIGGTLVRKQIEQSFLLPLKRPNVLVGENAHPPKGILLYGPPGTGKTMTARAIASELRDVDFYVVGLGEVMSRYVGDGERFISQLFQTARASEKKNGAIIFIDEIDSIMKRRDSGAGDSSEVRVRILNQFLSSWDGIQAGSKVLVIGATNLPHVIDEAALRRFSICVELGLPDTEDRFSLLKRKLVHERSSVSDNFLHTVVVPFTEGFSASDMVKFVGVVRSMLIERMDSHTPHIFTENEVVIRPGVRHNPDDFVVIATNKTGKRWENPRADNAVIMYDVLFNDRMNVDKDGSSVFEVKSWAEIDETMIMPPVISESAFLFVIDNKLAMSSVSKSTVDHIAKFTEVYGRSSKGVKPISPEPVSTALSVQNPVECDIIVVNVHKGTQTVFVDLECSLTQTDNTVVCNVESQTDRDVKTECGTQVELDIMTPGGRIVYKGDELL